MEIGETITPLHVRLLFNWTLFSVERNEGETHLSSVQFWAGAEFPFYFCGSKVIG